MPTGPGWYADYALYFDLSKRWVLLQGWVIMRTLDVRISKMQKCVLSPAALTGSLVKMAGDGELAKEGL